MSNGCKFYAEMFSIPNIDTHFKCANSRRRKYVEAQKSNKIKIQERKTEGIRRDEKERQKPKRPQQQQQSHNINNNIA